VFRSAKNSEYSSSIHPLMNNEKAYIESSQKSIYFFDSNAIYGVNDMLLNTKIV